MHADYSKPAAADFNVFDKDCLTVPGNDFGAEVWIELNYDFLAPIPKIEIGNESLELPPLLQCYQYAWIGIPFFMILGGRAMGGFVGMPGAYASGRAFRGNYRALAKFGISALITLGAFVAYAVVAAWFHLLIGAPKR